MKNYEVVFNHRGKIENVSLISEDFLLIGLFTCNQNSSIVSLSDHLMKITKSYGYTYYYYYYINDSIDEVIKYISIIHNNKEGE